MPGFDPSDWLDVLVYGLFAVPATIAAYAAYRKAKDAHYEVTNDHGTNIRHDIDDLRDDIKQGFALVNQRLTSLDERLIQEQKERMEGDRLRVIRGG